MLSRQVVVKPERPHARLAGFTLIELLAVLVIISSTSWLLIRAFDPSSHSTFQFSRIFNQYVMRAQSHALANQSDSARPVLALQSRDGVPVLQLRENATLLAQYAHDSQLDVTLLKDGALLTNYDFVFDHKAMLDDYPGSVSLELDIASRARYCIVENGLLRPAKEECSR